MSVTHFVVISGAKKKNQLNSKWGGRDTVI